MNDVLGLLAEIAVAFTGFAALVSALGTAPSGADPRVDRLRLRNLVELGVIAVLMATLPLVLSRSALPGDSVWTVSSTVMLAAMGFYFIRIAASLLTHKLNGGETIPD